MAQVIILLRQILGLARILEVQSNHWIPKKTLQQTILIFTPKKHSIHRKEAQRLRLPNWTAERARANLRRNQGQDWATGKVKEVGAIRKTSPRLQETGLRTSHPISFLNRLKTSKDAAKGQHPGSCVVGEWSHRTISEGCYTERTQNTQTQSGLACRWQAWQVSRTMALLTEQLTKRKCFRTGTQQLPLAPGSWSRRAVTGSQDCRAALPGHTGDRARRRAPKHRANQAAKETSHGLVPMGMGTRHDLQWHWPFPYQEPTL